MVRLQLNTLQKSCLLHAHFDPMSKKIIVCICIYIIYIDQCVNMLYYLLPLLSGGILIAVKSHTRNCLWKEILRSLNSLFTLLFLLCHVHYSFAQIGIVLLQIAYHLCLLFQDFVQTVLVPIRKC